MAYPSFTDTLMSAKRRSQLTGRRLTDADVSGVASGYFDTAYDRTMAARKLALQEDALSQQQSQFAETLAQQKLSDQAAQDAAKKATTQGYVNTGVSALGTGAIIKSMYKPSGSEPSSLGNVSGDIDAGVYDAPNAMQYKEGIVTDKGGNLVANSQDAGGDVFSPAGTKTTTTPETFGSGAAVTAGAAGTGTGAQGLQYVGNGTLVSDGNLVANAGNTAGTTAPATGGSLYSSVAGPLAIIGATEAVRGGWGQTNKSYGERSPVAKFNSAPVLGGVSAINTGVFGHDSGFTHASDHLSQIEDETVGQALDKYFEGDILGGLEQSAEGLINAPRNVANAIGDTIQSIVEPVKKATVVCTELHRQGLIPAEVYEYDALYEVPEDVYQGYLKIAAPIVAKMKKSKAFTSAVAMIAIPTATEMASRVNPEIKGTIIGKIVLAVMIPICGFVGKTIDNKVLCS